MDYNAWAVARLRNGAALDGINVDRVTGHWREYVGICRAINGGNRLEAFEHWVETHPERAAIWGAIMHIPKNATEYAEPDVPAPQYRKFAVDVPDLPKAARLTSAESKAATHTGEWVSVGADYVGAVVPTMPRDAIESAFLTVASIATARRLVLPISFGDIYPILWILWVYASTVFGKTTALNVIRKLVADTMPHLLLPQESSNDRLIQNMAGVKHANWDQLPLWKQDQLRLGWNFAAQRGIIVDEASKVFGSFEKEYNRGKIETFLTAYDCTEQLDYETNKYGLIHIRHLYMPFMGATTPESVQFANTNYMWASGFWPRFCHLVPEVQFPDDVDEPDYATRLPRPALLSAILNRMLEGLPTPPVSDDPHNPPDKPAQIACNIDADALKRWSDYRRAMRHDFQNEGVVPDHRLRLMCGRMPIKMLNVAMLYAALDWKPGDQPAPRITTAHMAAAHVIAEKWRVNAYRFLEVMTARPDGEMLDQRILATIRQITTGGKDSTTREIVRALHWDRDLVEDTLKRLHGDGMVESVPSSAGRTKVWRVVTK